MGILNCLHDMMSVGRQSRIAKTQATIHEGMKLVKEKYGEDLSQYGPMFVEDEGSEAGYRLDWATLMADLSSFVYLGDAWWESDKAGKGMACSPAEFSLNCKFWCGQLEVEGHAVDREALTATKHWNFLPLDPQHDRDFAYSKRKRKFMGTVRSGMVVERGSDSQALILVNKEERYVVLTVRGTSSSRDAIIDMDCRLCRSPVGPGKIHHGFKSAYLRLASGILPALHQLFSERNSDTSLAYQRLFITGHSLGGALGTLLAVAVRNLCPHIPRVSVYTFGSPMVGNQTFVDDYNSKIPDTWRHVNDQDLITVYPPHWLGYRHVSNKVYMNDFGLWINPAKETIFVDPAIDPQEDHELGNYKRLIGQYRAVAHIPANQLETIYRAWIAHIDRPAKAMRVMVKSNKQNRADGSWLSIIEAKTVAILGFETALQLLVDEIGLDPYVCLLIEPRIRQIAHNNRVMWSHFLIAVYDLFYSSKCLTHIHNTETRAMLEKFDVDGDGFLEFDEFLMAYQDIFGAEIGVDEVAAEFKMLDLDSDQRISYAEFRLWNIVCKQSLSEGAYFAVRQNIKRSSAKLYGAGFVHMNSKRGEAAFLEMDQTPVTERVASHLSSKSVDRAVAEALQEELEAGGAIQRSGSRISVTPEELADLEVDGTGDKEGEEADAVNEAEEAVEEVNEEEDTGSQELDLADVGSEGLPVADAGAEIAEEMSGAGTSEGTAERIDPDLADVTTKMTANTPKNDPKPVSDVDSSGIEDRAMLRSSPQLASGQPQAATEFENMPPPNRMPKARGMGPKFSHLKKSAGSRSVPTVTVTEAQQKAVLMARFGAQQQSFLTSGTIHDRKQQLLGQRTTQVESQ